jgi:hypothetical protein
MRDLCYKEKTFEMYENLIKVIISGLIFVPVISLLSTQSFAQTTDTLTNMTDLLFDDFFPMVSVEYESDSIVVLRSNENVILPLNGSLAPLWNAIDMVEKEGNFEFKQFVTTELTIDDKLTTDLNLVPSNVFYALLSK